MSKCAGYEVVCPDGRVRTYPYHNQGDAESHVKIVNDPAWFAERACRLAPNPSKYELSKGPCPGGQHVARPILFEHDET